LNKSIIIVVFFIISSLWASTYPSREEIKDFVDDICSYYHNPKVNTVNIMSIIEVESHFINGKKSPKGAIGVMQIMEICYKDMVWRYEYLRKYKYESLRWDWKANILFGIAYFNFCLRQKNDLKLALTAYNYGPWHKNPTNGYSMKVLKAIKKRV
jgi:soluble lytic murein transglycosylase-like protein